MTGRLQGKIALVTGAGSGIGRATALRFAEEGADIVVAGRDRSPLQATVDEVVALGRRALRCKVDVRHEHEVEQMVWQAVAEFGFVDILVAAAGIPSLRKPVLETSLSEWREIIETNLDGIFLTDRAVARAMIAAGRGGRIINIASAAVIRKPLGSGPYVASKSGVWALTGSLARELGVHGITCNTIGPGLTDTPLAQPWIREARSKLEQGINAAVLEPWTEPRQIANTALFLASDEASYYTGSIFFPDGGLNMH